VNCSDEPQRAEDGKGYDHYDITLSAGLLQTVLKIYCLWQKREGRSKSKFSSPWKSQNSKDGKSSMTGHMQSPLDSSSRLNDAGVGTEFCAERRIDRTVCLTSSRDRIAPQVPACRAVGCCRGAPRHVRWGGLDGILAVVHHPPYDQGSLHTLQIISDIYIVKHILMYYSKVNFSQKIYVLILWSDSDIFNPSVTNVIYIWSTHS